MVTITFDRLSGTESYNIGVVRMKIKSQVQLVEHKVEKYIFNFVETNTENWKNSVFFVGRDKYLCKLRTAKDLRRLLLFKKIG